MYRKSKLLIVIFSLFIFGFPLYAQEPTPTLPPEFDYKSIFEVDENGVVKNPISYYPTPKTAHQRIREHGKRKRPYEVPLEKAIPGCGYSPGYRDPDICVDDNSNTIYKRGWDKKILEDLKRKYRVQERYEAKYGKK